MTMLDTLIGIIGSACLVIIGWAFKINSQVAVLEQRDEDIKELLESRFDDVDSRLERIERAMNGALRGH